MADLHDDPDLPAGERYTHPFPSPGGFETALVGLPIPPLPDGPRSWPRVPRYEIVEQLGRGGMGVVYKARQLGLNRTVALKMILHGELAGEEELRRFRAEAEVVAHLQHPNIVQVYEVGEVGGQPFFSQEFIDGGSLAERLIAGPWVGRAAAELIETLARAIHVAHERGLVHRDLKPANILLTRDGIPKIADFGLAKRLQQEAGQTQTGHIIGTPSYMAPEQASGLVRATRPATDVYALGAILYELLTGRPPFLAATMLDTLEQVRRHDPVPPRQLLPTVPRDLETICLKCLDKTQDRRFATAEQLADELRRFLRGEPIRSRPLSPWHRAAKWVRRQPAIAALSALVLLITALGIAGIVWQWRLAERHRQTAETRATGEIAAGVAREAALASARPPPVLSPGRPGRPRLGQERAGFGAALPRRHPAGAASLGARPASLAVRRSAAGDRDPELRRGLQPRRQVDRHRQRRPRVRLGRGRPVGPAAGLARGGEHGDLPGPLLARRPPPGRWR
ncbi:MAG: serine/threonine-protein kinase [Gemmataceae bacterium]